MTPRETSNLLRIVEKDNKKLFYFTGELRISDMAKDAADAIDSLQAFVDFVNGLPDCNCCGNTNCGYRPALGQPIRYNCPLWLSLKGE